ncbi:hypothetical protein [Helicobacter trogontum]|uniref:Uncharacterized protein n=1 Tax=Helicobacter trogontum TaxID=50960 RepID=A0A4V6HYA9_9HELI|nr:hypothetical protein [Helicobacter trogontum]TLD79892.1 hypothetical protein LS81_009960 [Helicobacter trogontum]
MIGYLMRIGCGNCIFFLIFASLVFANSFEDIAKQKYLLNLPYNKENIITKSYNIHTDKKDFILITLFNWDDDELGRAVKKYSCISIFDSDVIMQNFCFSDNIGIVANKNDFFTLTSLWQDRIGNITNTYLTFRLIENRFYLHQYSKEFEHIDDDQEITNNTQIYYRQPRDDPKKEKLIPLDSINDELLQELKNVTSTKKSTQ